MEINNVPELDALEQQVLGAVSENAHRMRTLLAELGNDPHALHRAMKYDARFTHPVTRGARTLSEAVNQTETALVAVAAVRLLAHHHPEAFPFTLHLCEEGGMDIAGAHDSVVAETFATTTYRANSKLSRSVTSVLAHSKSSHKYVVFRQPGRHAGRQGELEKNRGCVLIYCV